MSIDPNQIWNNASAENGKFVKVNIPGLSEKYPNGTYAILTMDIGSAASSATPTLSSASILENTAYQDTPFNNQVSVTTSSSQITNLQKKGWMTLSINPDTTHIVYIGDSNVTTGNGYFLSPKTQALQYHQITYLSGMS